MTCSTLKLTGLVVAIAVALASGPGQAASKTDLPSASPSGGEPLRAGGNAELTREQLAVFVRDYPGPNPIDLRLTDGEEHDDDERAAPTTFALSQYLAPSVNGEMLESPQPITSWKAMDQAGGTAGDATIAVSTTHVLVTNRTTLRYFDKAGTMPKTLPATSLFSPLGLNAPSFVPKPIDAYFDMRALFDPHRKRFWVMALGINAAWRSQTPANMRHVTAVAVSKTENPDDGWWLYWWDSVPHWGAVNDDVYAPGDASDYPTIGIDTNLFHETHAVNNYAKAPPKTYKFWRVTFFGANEMAAGLSFANVKGWQFWDLKNPDGTNPNTIQAVVHHTASSFSFYVSRVPIDKNFPSDVVVVWGLMKPFQPGQKMLATALHMPEYWSPPNDGPQKTDVLGPDDTLIQMSNLGTHVLKAVYRNDLLYFTTHDAVASFTGMRYVRLLMNTYPAIFLDDVHKFLSRTFGVADAIEGDGYTWSGWPGVEVNKAGNVAIVFARTSYALFPQARFTTYFANEPDIRLSRLLKDGEATYHDGATRFDKDGNTIPMPWGDTGGASVDPKDDTSIWLAQQYSTSGAPIPNYAIWVGKVFGFVYFDLTFDNVRVESVDVTIPQMKVSGRVHNGGDGTSPDAQLSFFLVKGRSSALLGTLSQGVLRPGEDGDFRVTLPLPRNVTAGSYELKVVAETSSPKNEYSTGNNVSVVPFDLR